ncbi:MAG TPA: PilZ domain-containing protein [Stellaceae bacterium]|nr:PilZ domain-containing protein [Stellaceae bacterium]
MGTNGTITDRMVNGAPAAGRRRSRRKPVMWAARLETEAGDHDCVAFDISAGGAKLRLEARVALNRSVVLVLERFGPLQAETVWRRGTTLGLRFVDRPDAVRRMLGDALPL